MTRDLPDMYTSDPKEQALAQALGVHIRQTTHARVTTTYYQGCTNKVISLLDVSSSVCFHFSDYTTN